MSQSLPHLKIGSVDIGFPVVQAALSGYSDWPMRAVARRLGASYTLCEVLLDQFVVSVTRGNKAKKYLRVVNEDHPCGAQLMGSKPEDFPPAAAKLLDAGFDVIDLNFGCPVRKVLGRCRGGFLLSTPDVALEMVRRTRDFLPDRIPLTVKMRRGMDADAESLDNFYEIFDGSFACGAAAITVHGRTVRQRYEGRSSWEFLKEVKRHAGDKIVLGSGDLFTAQDCLDMIAQTGVDGVTVARGAIGNPWIFKHARALAEGKTLAPPSLFEQREVIASHYQLADELYGPKKCSALMRKFGIKYARMHPNYLEVRAAFIAVKGPGTWREVLDRYYAEDLPGVWPAADEEFLNS